MIDVELNEKELNQIWELLISSDLESVKLGAALAKDYDYGVNIEYLKYKCDRILDSDSWSLDMLNDLDSLKWGLLAYKIRETRLNKNIKNQLKLL